TLIADINDGRALADHAPALPYRAGERLHVQHGIDVTLPVQTDCRPNSGRQRRLQVAGLRAVEHVVFDFQTRLAQVLELVQQGRRLALRAESNQERISFADGLGDPTFGQPLVGVERAPAHRRVSPDTRLPPRPGTVPGEADQEGPEPGVR